MRGIRGTFTWIAAAAAVIGLAGAGHAKKARGWAKAGLVFEVHEKDVQNMKMVIHLPSGDRTQPIVDRFTEVRRVRVLKVDHGIPTEIQVTYVAMTAPDGGHATAKLTKGHTYRVVAGAHAGDDPSVTSMGKAVSDKVAHKVRGDVDDYLGPGPGGELVPLLEGHPGKKVTVPTKTLDGLIGPDDHLKSSHDQAALMKKGAHGIHLQIWAHHVDAEGPTTLHISLVGPALLDATGQLVSESYTAKMSGKGMIKSPAGPLPVEVTGGGTMDVKVVHPSAK